jgi:anti-sigma B factor antagonist
VGIELTLDRVTGAIRVRGELDLANEAHIRQGFKALTKPGRPATLDLHEVTFMDSTGLRVLIELAKSTSSPVTVVGAPANVTRVFAVTGVDRFIPNLLVVKNGEEAADSA